MPSSEVWEHQHPGRMMLQPPTGDGWAILGARGPAAESQQSLCQSWFIHRSGPIRRAGPRRIPAPSPRLSAACEGS